MAELVVIGSSWGGLHAVGAVLGGLPAELGVPIAVAQHRSASSADDGLAQTLSDRSPLPVRDVDDKDPVTPNQVHLAPADYHLLVDRGCFALSTEERVQYSRPSIDVLFESAAAAYGSGVVAVLLTGANEDGTAGLQQVRAHGGLALVQDPSTAERPRMPASAIAARAYDVVAPLERIAAEIVAACRPPGRALGGSAG